MEVNVQVVIEAPPRPFGNVCVTPDADNNVKFQTPQELTGAGFPVGEASFSFPAVSNNGNLTAHADSIANGFRSKKQNSVCYAYGARLTNRRESLLGSTTKPGLLSAVLNKVMATPIPSGEIYQVMCYGIGADADGLEDYIDGSNKEGVLIETVREGPRINKIDRVQVKTAADVTKVISTVAANYEKSLQNVLVPPTSPEEQALPPYDPTSIVFTLHRFANEDDHEAGVEANSLTFIALGDSERPVLCGLDAQHMQLYDRTHKTLAAVWGVLSAIRSSRLRIPFGKSKLTSLLKRAYNSEKNYAYASENAPTQSYFFVFAHNDEGSAEETYHTLAMTRRVTSVLTSASVGVPTRDLAADKWRLEQDIVELKDELAIAKAVHGYKPCIFEQAKPVANIQEEENKRIGKIREQQEAQKKRAKEEVLEAAQKEAAALIAAEESKCSLTLQELEATIAKRQEENRTLIADRQKKEEEHRQRLDKIRKKKEEEESQAEALREEVERLKAEVEAKQVDIKEKEHQLYIASQDAAKGREAVLAERAAKRKQREALYEERRQQRTRWLEEIRIANDRLIGQVNTLATLRKERVAARGDNAPADAKDVLDEETEEAVRDDIQSINDYLPKLISLDDVPADVEAADNIRKQLEDYFAQEKESYGQKLEMEKSRLAALEKSVDQFRARVTDFQAQRRKELLAEAAKKEHHVQSLVDDIIQYLQHGIRMYKVSSNGMVRRRFFFLSDDCKKMFGCDLDENQLPLNRKKPTTTIVFKDLKRVLLGTYSPSFTNFAGGEAKLRITRAEAMTDNGSHNPARTQPPTPETLGKYTYRSFCLEIKGSKTVELVCDTDSDCEAWLLALKRVLYYRTPIEQQQDAAHNRIVPDCICPLHWGAALEIRGRPGADKLSVDEATLCSNQHIPPKLFLQIKQTVSQLSQNSWVTIFDIRRNATIDMLRAQALHEFFTESGVISAPTG